jgi:PDZ domain/Aspartyl protease
MVRRFFLLGLVIALAATLVGGQGGFAARAQAAPAATSPLHTIPFELYENRIYIQVAGPGFGPEWFLLDTGAQVTHYDAALVARAGLRTQGRVGISGTGPGRIDGTYVRATSLRIGSLTLPVRRGVAAPADALFGAVFEGTGRRFEGVVGADLFASFDVEIDYPARRLRLYPANTPAPASGETLRMRLIGRKPYIAVTVASGSWMPMANLQLDTGFGGAVSLNGNFVEQQGLTRRLVPLLPTWSRGVGGVAEARVGRLDALRLGGTVVPRPIVTLALTQGAGVRADSAGRIGGDLLRRFTIRLSYAADRVTFTPNPALGEAFDTDMSGLSLIRVADDILVWRIVPGSPASEAGVVDGDRLLAIDGRPASALSLEAVRALLRQDGVRRSLTFARSDRIFEAAIVLRRRV